MTSGKCGANKKCFRQRTCHTLKWRLHFTHCSHPEDAFKTTSTCQYPPAQMPNPHTSQWDTYTVTLVKLNCCRVCIEQTAVKTLPGTLPWGPAVLTVPARSNTRSVRLLCTLKVSARKSARWSCNMWLRHTGTTGFIVLCQGVKLSIFWVNSDYSLTLVSVLAQTINSE